MLLRYEVYKERALLAMDIRAEKTRAFAHLKVDPIQCSDGTMYYTGSRDLLRAIPLNTPTKFELSADEEVTVTSIDANHCPGAVMYLIEGSKGAILHTGDFRAEPWFLDGLTRHPSLQPYIHNGYLHNLSPEDRALNPVMKTLDAIYLDTATVTSQLNVPSKNRATSGLIELMKLYPPSTHFFINSWTWGYEDILKAIAQAFNAPIHLDRYKFSIFKCLSDSFLRRIATSDPAATRFHACERFDRCDHVAVDDEVGKPRKVISRLGKRVVYVNPVSMDEEKWDEYLTEHKALLEKGEAPSVLLVPLSRHSPLPELRAFVKLFRPRRVVPNTLTPDLRGLDWFCIDRMFADCLASPLSNPLSLTADPRVKLDAMERIDDEEGDAALKNLVGAGADDAAARWARDGHLRKRIGVLAEHLTDDEIMVVDRLLTGKPLDLAAMNKAAASTPAKADVVKPGAQGALPVLGLTARALGKQPARVLESDEETEDDEEGEKTMHKLFWKQAGMTRSQAMLSSSPASKSSAIPSSPAKASLVSSSPSKPLPSPIKIREGVGVEGAWDIGPTQGGEMADRMTPVSSPMRPPRTPSSHAKRKLAEIAQQTPTPASKRRAADGPILRPITSYGLPLTTDLDALTVKAEVVSPVSSRRLRSATTSPSTSTPQRARLPSAFGTYRVLTVSPRSEARYRMPGRRELRTSPLSKRPPVTGTLLDERRTPLAQRRTPLAERSRDPNEPTSPTPRRHATASPLRAKPFHRGLAMSSHAELANAAHLGLVPIPSEEQVGMNERSRRERERCLLAAKLARVGYARNGYDERRKEAVGRIERRLRRESGD
ncbi:hypothetical protein EV122DRAFT_287229 [Schizophyllum commune]